MTFVPFLVKGSTFDALRARRDLQHEQPFASEKKTHVLAAILSVSCTASRIKGPLPYSRYFISWGLPECL